MKVLKRGKLSKPFTIEIKCQNDECEAKLLAEERDIKYLFYDKDEDDKFAGINEDYYVICPECRKMVIIDEEALPEKVKTKAKAKKRF